MNIVMMIVIIMMEQMMILISRMMMMMQALQIRRICQISKGVPETQLTELLLPLHFFFFKEEETYFKSMGKNYAK